MQQAALEGLRKELDTFVPRVQQVMRQAKQRIFGGNTQVAEKLVSICPNPLPKSFARARRVSPPSLARWSKFRKARIRSSSTMTYIEKRPSDSELVISAIDAHEKALGGTPRLMAAAFYSAKNAATAHDRGVKRVCIPNRSTKSAERKREQKKRWFKEGQKWRTGCEGRSSVLKRRHGLRRCNYRGDAGMKRWVGLGVIADNLHPIGADLANRKS
jgi:IS5 family transposase